MESDILFTILESRASGFDCFSRILRELYSFRPFTFQLPEGERNLKEVLESCIQEATQSWFSITEAKTLPTVMVSVCVCVCVRVCARARVHVCLYVCVFVCVHVEKIKMEMWYTTCRQYSGLPLIRPPSLGTSQSIL